MEILWEDTVSAEFRVIHPKLHGNFAFPQNFYTRKLDEVTVFYAVYGKYIMIPETIRTTKDFMDLLTEHLSFYR